MLFSSPNIFSGLDVKDDVPGDAQILVTEEGKKGRWLSSTRLGGFDESSYFDFYATVWSCKNTF